jgi:hypothetical protein
MDGDGYRGGHADILFGAMSSSPEQRARDVVDTIDHQSQQMGSESLGECRSSTIL